MRRRVLALTMSTLGLLGLGCASTQTCRQQAKIEYQRCVNPLWVDEGGAVEPTRSDTTQTCRTSYHQALTACGDVDPVPPVPEIRTSTRGAARP